MWKSNKLTASQSRSSITQRVGEVARKMAIVMGSDYCRRLSEKTGLETTTDGNDDSLINLEAVPGGYVCTRAPLMSETRVARRAAQRNTSRKRVRHPAGGPEAVGGCSPRRGRRGVQFAIYVCDDPKTASNLYFAESFHRFKE